MCRMLKNESVIWKKWRDGADEGFGGGSAWKFGLYVVFAVMVALDGDVASVIT